MEQDLACAVVVTMLGSRPEVDMADVAAVLHHDFGVGPMDMSVRPFFPEDFLVLCRTPELKRRMIAQGAPRMCGSRFLSGHGCARPRRLGHPLPSSFL